MSSRVTKYRAKRTSCGAHVHASKKEAARCTELTLMAHAGWIRALVQQPEFEMHGVKYRADFEYEEKRSIAGVPVWEYTVEDSKGFVTPVFRIKRTLMKNCLGITIRET